MLGLFNRHSKLKGLDISTSWARAVHLRCKKNNLYLEQSWEGGIDELSRTHSKIPVAIAVPYSNVECQTLTVDPRLKPFEIEVLVEETFPSNNWWVDFSCREKKVHVVACPKEVMSEKLQALRERHIIPRILDVDLFAIERLFMLFRSGMKSFPTVAGLYNHGPFCSFSVFQDKQVVFRAYQAVSNEREGERELEEMVKQYTFAFEGPPLDHVMVMSSPLSGEALLSFVQKDIQCSASFNIPLQVISGDANKTNASWALAFGLALRAFPSP